MISSSYQNEWFLDSENQHRIILHRTKGQVALTKTEYQTAKIVDTYCLGRILILDNKIQSAESDEFIYHESLVHPPMIHHGGPERVLILGGGEGATLREVLRYKSVRHVTMVDIDKKLVELCDEHLQKWHCGSFHDHRVNLIFDDAMKYVGRTKDKFDVIIMDISDPVQGGPADVIYTREFFQIVRDLLISNGIFATQAVEVFYDSSDLHSILHNTLAASFITVESYCEYIPSFGSMWGFLICSQRESRASALSPAAIDMALKKNLSNDLKYYDGTTHQRLFALPKVLRHSLNNQTKISTVSNPINVCAGVL